MNITQKIEKLLENSVLFTEDQKQSWLNLLPKMNLDELSELFVILRDEVKELKKEGISLIDDSALEAELTGSDDVQSHGASLELLKQVATQATPAQEQAFDQELRREVTTPELRKPTTAELGTPTLTVPKPPVHIPMAPKPVVPTPHADSFLAPMPRELRVPMAPTHKPAPAPISSMGLKSLMDIKAVDDFKKVQPEHLRQGELRAQIDLIKSKILSLAQTNKILPFYTVAAFEESPLYKTYLTIGSNLILDPSPDRTNAYEAAAKKAGPETLTIREFEAIADLRKQIEQL